MSQDARPLRRPSLWKVPLIAFLIGCTVTATFAGQQQRAAEQRAEDRFGAEAETLGNAISQTISARITEFDVTVDFVSSANSISEGQFTTFLDQRRSNRSSPIPGDPGFTVTEYAADANALETRERDAGRDFSIFAPLPNAGERRLIITHLERDTPVFGRSMVGFDVSSFEGSLTPPGLLDSTSRTFARITPSDDLFGGLRLFGTPTSPDEAEYEDAIIYLIANWRAPDAQTSGVITRLESVSSIVEEVRQAIPDGFRLTARFDDGESIAVVDERQIKNDDYEATLNIVGSSRDEVIDLGALRFDLVASNEIQDASRGFSNPRLWLIGLGGSLLVAFFALARARQARRLADTGVELEIAQTMASTDPLTGLLNRQGLVDVTELPHPRPGVLLFIDLDNFKVVNDQDGHAAGDRVLRRIGELLRDLVRVEDAVCRLGGDEFLIFLPDPIEASRIDDLHRRIPEAVAAIDDRISASVGVASRTPDSMLPIENLLRKSDAAMYADKRAKQGSRR